MGKLQNIIFYIESDHDFSVIENILPNIKYSYQLVTSNKNLAEQLKQRGIHVIAWPAFPKTVFMVRHAFHRFPLKSIKKIGIRHGPYHFKKMIKAKKYNQFDLYIFGAEHEVKIAEKNGVSIGVAGGHPKIDTFFKDKTMQKCNTIKQQLCFDKMKNTLLFTTTWDKSGLSAVDKWIDHLPKLINSYNVLLSMHPMMSEYYVKKAQSIPGIFFTDSDNLPAYMLAADFLISDTSSVMGEFCALDKPIITFKVEEGLRLTGEIRQMIKDISIQIDNIEDLESAIEQYIKNPKLRSNNRIKWRNKFYGDINVSHGKKVADIINSFMDNQIVK